MAPAYGALLERVRRARRGSGGVLLEGAHALKHAHRFGADIEVALTPDRDALAALLAEVAPDVPLPSVLVELDEAAWRAVTAGRELPSPSLAVARRPATGVSDVLRAPGRVVVLEEPRHLGNLGAVVRVAAAAGAGGVLVVGGADPWHPTAVRAAAGLQFALPVARCDELPATGGRAVVALDASPALPPRAAGPAEGGPAGPGHDASLPELRSHGTPTADLRPVPRWELPADAIVLFGSERHGLSPARRARASATLAIPMRRGVSSLNLATAVAVTLYADVLGG